MARKFFIDTTDLAFVKSDTDSGRLLPADFFNGDSDTVEVHFLKQTGIFGRPYSYLDKSGASIKVGLGALRAVPTSGTWTITLSGDTTAALAYNITAAALSTAVNALASVTSAGGVTITKSAFGSRYAITFVTAAAQAAFTVTDSSLVPDTTAIVSERIAGSGSVQEVQEIFLSPDPVALQTSFSNLASAVTATPSTVTAGTSTASEVQQIDFAPAPVGGTFSITLPSDTRSVTAAVVAGVFTTTTNHGFAVGQPVVGTGFTTEANWTEGTTYYIVAAPSPTTFTIAATSGGAAITTATADSGTGTITTPARTTAEIDFDASVSAVQTALVALDTIGTDNVSVSGTPGVAYVLSFTGSKQNANFPQITVEDAILSAPLGKTGTLTLSTFSLQDLFDVSGASELTLVFEVEVTESGKIQTYSASVSISEDIIKAGNLSPTPVPGVGRYGAEAIGSGVSTLDVTFSTALTVAPTTIICTIEVPSGEGLIYAAIEAASIATTGFTANFSGPTDSANYLLHYYAIA